MPVTYFAENRALTLLERMVHLNIHPAEDTSQFVCAELRVPEEFDGIDHVRVVSADELEAADPAWRQQGNRTCLKIGTTWFRDGTHWALEVPSAVVPQESVLVVNCAHPVVNELRRRLVLRLDPITLDPRIADIIDRDALERRRSTNG
jgi:RES domain-containing protein